MTLERGLALVVIGGLLQGVGDAKDGLLGEGAADDLHADGEAIHEAGGDADAGEAGDIDGDGADVAEVHLQGVIDLLSDLEGHGRRGWGDKGIDAPEGLVELATDEGADPL